MPKFIIEQIAINPPKPKEAEELLKAIGLGATVFDTVHAKGTVFDDVAENKAHLSFAYQNNPNLEFETLNYIDGNNWLDDSIVERSGSVSHIGMHIEAEELVEWLDFFDARKIKIAQEVKTLSHQNEFLIETGRRYHYVIFDTREILGVDLKFIIRIKGANE